MHADICEPSDTEAVARFQRALRSLNAEVLRDCDSSLGVRAVEVRIGQETLFIFADACSVDIEGSPNLVQQVMAAMAESR